MASVSQGMALFFLPTHSSPTTVVVVVCNFRTHHPRYCSSRASSNNVLCFCQGPCSTYRIELNLPCLTHVAIFFLKLRRRKLCFTYVRRTVHVSRRLRRSAPKVLDAKTPTPRSWIAPRLKSCLDHALEFVFGIVPGLSAAQGQTTPLSEVNL